MAVRLAMKCETAVLMFLLRARLPAKYREKNTVSFDGPVPLTIMYSDERGVTDEAPSLPDASTKSIA